MSVSSRVNGHYSGTLHLNFVQEKIALCAARLRHIMNGLGTHYNMDNNMMLYQPRNESGVDSGGAVALSFSSEPPKSHRKSNFFHFDLKTESHVTVTEARFARFVDNGTPVENQNGIMYVVYFHASNAPAHSQNFVKYLYVWLVDAETDELITYQGKFTDGRLRRVFLTHELDCARCMGNQSCGNINEMPSNPVLLSQSELRFHLKCNQNCLRSSGNPKEVRRFKILVTMSDTPLDKGAKVARSRRWFVHNNSKPPGGKKRKAEKALPRIATMVPKSGSALSPLVVVGEHFHERLLIYLDDTPLHTQMLTETALATVLPNLGPSCAKTLSLRSDTEIYEYDLPFHYITPKYHECRNSENCEACRNILPMTAQMMPDHGVVHTQDAMNVPKQEPEFGHGNVPWMTERMSFHSQEMATPPYQYMGMYTTHQHQGGINQGVLPYSPPTSPPNQMSANLRTNLL